MKIDSGENSRKMESYKMFFAKRTVLCFFGKISLISVTRSLLGILPTTSIWDHLGPFGTIWVVVGSVEISVVIENPRILHDKKIQLEPERNI